MPFLQAYYHSFLKEDKKLIHRLIFYKVLIFKIVRFVIVIQANWKNDPKDINQAILQG